MKTFFAIGLLFGFSSQVYADCISKEAARNVGYHFLVNQGETEANAQYIVNGMETDVIDFQVIGYTAFIEQQGDAYSGYVESLVVSCEGKAAKTKEYYD